MKKSFLMLLFAGIAGIAVLGAFADEKSPEEMAQEAKMNSMVTEKLDVLRAQLDDQCKGKALVMAIPVADSLMVARAEEMKKGTNSIAPTRKPKPSSKPTITTPKPKPAPTTKGGSAANRRGETTTTSGGKGAAASDRRGETTTTGEKAAQESGGKGKAASRRRDGGK